MAALRCARNSASPEAWEWLGRESSTHPRYAASLPYVASLEIRSDAACTKNDVRGTLGCEVDGMEKKRAYDSPSNRVRQDDASSGRG